MPSEMTMVEKVARAMHQTLMDDRGSDAWVDQEPADLAQVSVDGTIDLQRLARAAIAAMWLPTPAMIQKGLVERIADFNEYEEQYEALTEQWHAMISAALQDPA